MPHGSLNWGCFHLQSNHFSVVEQKNVVLTFGAKVIVEVCGYLACNLNKPLLTVMPWTFELLEDAKIVICLSSPVVSSFPWNIKLRVN